MSRGRETIEAVFVRRLIETMIIVSVREMPASRSWSLPSRSTLVTSSGTSNVGTAVGTGVDGVAVIRLAGVPMKARPPFSCGILVGVAVGAGVSVGTGVGVDVSVGVALGPGVGVRVIVATGVKVAGSDVFVIEPVGVGEAGGSDAVSPVEPEPEIAPTSPAAALPQAWRSVKTATSKARTAKRCHVVWLATIDQNFSHEKGCFPYPILASSLRRSPRIAARAGIIAWLDLIA